jgi:hypothetical protein
MAVDLHVLADQVHDESSFLGFVAALAADWDEERGIEASSPSNHYSAGALGWENGTVGSVLDAAVRWGEASINGLQSYEKPANPWRRVAQILLAGKFYE